MTENTTASGAADDLHPVFTRVLPDLPDTKPFTLFKAGFRQALVTMASAPVAPTLEAEAVRWEFRWLNPANNPYSSPSEMAWKLVEPKGMQPLEAALSDLRACRYAGKPCYEVRPLFAQAAPVAPTPEGFVQAPHYRGYANLGTGQYVLNHTAPHESAELIISIASDEDKAGRTIGDDRGNPAGRAIQPDEMAVRLAFTSVAGLDALEKQLRYLREVHFPEAAPVAPAVGNSGFDYKTAADLLNGKTVRDEAIRKFVAASRWAHDDSAGLRATLLSARGELASREAEIALLKKTLVDAEPAPQPAPPQQGVAYAALPEKYYLAGGEVPTWDAKQMHAFADRTHALRVESLAAAYCEELDKLSQRNYELRLASHGQALRLLTQKEIDSLGRRAEGMDGNEWDQWVQEKFTQINNLRVQGGSYEWDWE